MRPTSTYIGVFALLALLGVGGAAPRDAEGASSTIDLELPDAPDPSPGYAIIPDLVPLSADALLEARLAAAVRARDLDLRMDAALVDFDVTGLAASLGTIVESLEDRANVSVHVRDLESQHVLFDYHGDSPLNPASNQKLLTSSAALDLLGADYTFATRVVREGNTLYLVGEGDPMLSTEDLQALAERVAEQVPLAEIEGLVVDGSAFSSRRFAPGFDTSGPGQAYTAPTGALSVDFNTVAVSVFPVRGSRKVGVHVTPSTADVVVHNRARTGSRNTVSVSTREADGRTVVEVAGRLPTTATAQVVRRRIYDPEGHAGAVFAEHLAQLSASVSLPVRSGVAPPDADPVAEHRSPPLIDVIDAGLAYSNNFMAEQILRTLAWRMTGDPGDWETGTEVLRGYWTALGNDPREIVVKNASGLTREGRVTTSGLVDLISVAHRTPDEAPDLLDALPVAGEPGTLRTRLRVSGKRVRAKTGTLDGVSGLTGVITREDGSPQVAFSILINAAEAQGMPASSRRAAEDRLVLAVLRHLDAYEARRAGMG